MQRFQQRHPIIGAPSLSFLWWEWWPLTQGKLPLPIKRIIKSKNAIDLKKSVLLYCWKIFLVPPPPLLSVRFLINETEILTVIFCLSTLISNFSSCVMHNIAGKAGWAGLINDRQCKKIKVSLCFSWGFNHPAHCSLAIVQVFFKKNNNNLYVPQNYYSIF